MADNTGRFFHRLYEKVFLVDHAGAILRTVARRPDRRWLERPFHAAVAPDGSLAVLAKPSRMFGDGPVAASLYDPRGEPVRLIPLPASLAGSFPRLAYDGARLAVAGDAEVLLFDATGRALGRFTPPHEGAAEPYWSPFLPPGGRELLLFDGRDALERFELP